MPGIDGCCREGREGDGAAEGCYFLQYNKAGFSGTIAFDRPEIRKQACHLEARGRGVLGRRERKCKHFFFPLFSPNEAGNILGRARSLGWLQRGRGKWRGPQVMKGPEGHCQDAGIPQVWEGCGWTCVLARSPRLLCQERSG